ncbi:hypothetical protein PSYJA_09706 [Pseudomonas syringae pv. japonica str. M301072]|uniref:Uncharacterized protein n=1 Tax=Pseudomonas syringae pv. japonica str. M301072 TaxID=629262 RepID=F3FG84_PSESX|nr:hypothetical protein PSYJA_09706 [Pseudomonas syringae pv. japonica str. M301072]
MNGLLTRQRCADGIGARAALAPAGTWHEALSLGRLDEALRTP